MDVELSTIYEIGRRAAVAVATDGTYLLSCASDARHVTVHYLPDPNLAPIQLGEGAGLRGFSCLCIGRGTLGEWRCAGATRCTLVLHVAAALILEAYLSDVDM